MQSRGIGAGGLLVDKSPQGSLYALGDLTASGATWASGRPRAMGDIFTSQQTITHKTKHSSTQHNTSQSQPGAYGYGSSGASSLGGALGDSWSINHHRAKYSALGDFSMPGLAGAAGSPVTLAP